MNTLQNLINAIAQNLNPQTQIEIDFLRVALERNLPWLFITCEILTRMHPDRKLYFLSRDCQLMYKLYSAYFSTNCDYVPFSRRIALHETAEAFEYLPKDGVFIDISSTGRSWQQLCMFHPYEITVAIYSDQFSYPVGGENTKPVPPPTFKSIVTNSQIGPTNHLIEVMNCADHGSLVSLNPPTTYPHELPQELVHIIHRPVNGAIGFQKFFPRFRDELKTCSDAELLEAFTGYLRDICSSHHLDKYLGEYHQKEADMLNTVGTALPVINGTATLGGKVVNDAGFNF